MAVDPAATVAGTLEETLKSVESLLRQTLDAHQGWKSSSQTKVGEPFSELSSSHLAFGMFLQFIVRMYHKMLTIMRNVTVSANSRRKRS